MIHNEDVTDEPVRRRPRRRRGPPPAERRRPSATATPSSTAERRPPITCSPCCCCCCCCCCYYCCYKKKKQKNADPVTILDFRRSSISFVFSFSSFSFRLRGSTDTPLAVTPQLRPLNRPPPDCNSIRTSNNATRAIRKRKRSRIKSR